MVKALKHLLIATQISWWGILTSNLMLNNCWTNNYLNQIKAAHCGFEYGLETIRHILVSFLQPEGVLPFWLLQFDYWITTTTSMAVGYVHLWKHSLLLLLQMTAHKMLNLEWICLKVSWRWFATPNWFETAIDSSIFCLDRQKRGKLDLNLAIVL